MHSLKQQAVTRGAGATTAAVARPSSLTGARRPHPQSRPTIALSTKAPVHRPTVLTRGLGDSAVGGFLDLAKLVSGSQGQRSPYDDLAFAIGRDVYADLGGWHIFLKDLSVEPGAPAKMATALAAEFGPRAADKLHERDIEAVLARVPVRLGGDRTTVSLLDLIPRGGVRDLTRHVEEFGRGKR